MACARSRSVLGLGSNKLHAFCTKKTFCAVQQQQHPQTERMCIHRTHSGGKGRPTQFHNILATQESPSPSRGTTLRRPPPPHNIHWGITASLHKRSAIDEAKRVTGEERKTFEQSGCPCLQLLDILLQLSGIVHGTHITCEGWTLSSPGRFRVARRVPLRQVLLFPCMHGTRPSNEWILNTRKTERESRRERKGCRELPRSANTYRHRHTQ